MFVIYFTSLRKYLPSSIYVSVSKLMLYITFVKIYILTATTCFLIISFNSSIFPNSSIVNNQAVKYQFLKISRSEMWTLETSLSLSSLRGSFYKVIWSTLTSLYSSTWPGIVYEEWYTYIATNKYIYNSIDIDN